MKVVFVSNYFNHHQKPFCEEMYKRLGENFVFVSTTTMRDERKKLGYSQENNPVYVHLAHVDSEQKQIAIDLINVADIVIVGSASHEFLRERIKLGKIVLRYSERPFKKKVSFIRGIYYAIVSHIKDFRNKNIYMLCASAYTAKDYRKMGLYRNRTFKWGYFPAVKEYDLNSLFSHKKKNVLLWCGRFIDWKHPDDAIFLAKKLKDSGYDFQLNFIGTGVMEKELHNLVKQFDLSDNVNFLGSMSPGQVRNYMEEASIYLFTSDQQEGWGAVLNESMNSGCALVASHAIGSVPFLIDNEVNGLIYESGNIDMMYEKVKYLLENPEEQSRLGKSAYKTIKEEWNAQIATKRLLSLINNLQEGKKTMNFYSSGPCSEAEIIRDNWLKE